MEVKFPDCFKDPVPKKKGRHTPVEGMGTADWPDWKEVPVGVMPLVCCLATVHRTHTITYYAWFGVLTPTGIHVAYL